MRGAGTGRGRLGNSLTELADAAATLRTAVVEDRPEVLGDRGRHKVIADLEQAIVDLHAAVEAQAPHGTRRSRDVVEAHRVVLEVSRLMRAVAGVEGLVHLASTVSKGWGPGWRSWVDVVRSGLHDVDACIESLQRDLLDIATELLDPAPAQMEETAT